MPHCKELAADGYIAANLSYRRVGEPGGGWPNTCLDVVTALRELGPLTAVLGHSTGGHLALWAACELTPRPSVVISIAGINDLEVARPYPNPERAVTEFLGGDDSQRAAANPSTRVPLGTRTVLIDPVDDPPFGHAMTAAYAAAARAAGDEVDLIQTPGDHFSILETTSPIWTAVRAALPA